MKPGVQINLRAKHQEEDKTRGNQGARIKLHVKSQDGQKVFFLIHGHTKLKKLLKAYCDFQYLDFTSTVFLFDGNRFDGEQTPDELGMKDGDEINAMFHQTDIQRAKINLKVTDQVFFHCYLLQPQVFTIFFFNGARFCGEQTSDELGMKDGDVINAIFHQTKNQGAEINPKVEEELKEAVDLVDELNAEAETLAHLECLQLSQ
ncbi:Ubiquitin-like domain superfamily [Arabidopsis suecica]|uniref:Ubiquitin-like domain superfamily n=1 Tax=Arabidopsis suecica TaxID=45249 RepID=A0A8T2APU4_ARASU|nr:Ubiquitin-like domain superfamily [Arabidopsis suecica]